MAPPAPLVVRCVIHGIRKGDTKPRRITGVGQPVAFSAAIAVGHIVGRIQSVSRERNE
jgi:hypothetical protein